MKAFITLLLLILSFSCKQNKSTKPIALDSVELKSVETVEKIIQPKIEKDFLLGKFNYRTHEDFQKVDSNHSSKSIYLQTKTYNAFKQMHTAAKLDGINLKIVSGTRNFEEQKAIWNRKWNTYSYLKPAKRIQKIMEYSSMPSTSRHHWGTDIDLNNLNNSYFDKGYGKKIYDWLVLNANKYGFYQVYTEKLKGRTGYNLERWHWSYLPLASHYLEVYNKAINYSDIEGFEGSTLAKELNIIKLYVNGIVEK